MRKSDNKTEIIFSYNERKCYYNYDDVFGKFVVRVDNGMIALEKDAVLLYEYFDSTFESIAIKLGALQERYPVLLKIPTMNKTGYFRRTPQYSFFCSNPIENFEDLNKMSDEMFCENSIDSILQKPSYTLSPSACFHSYEKYKNKTLQGNRMITFNQSVFRNEGRLNWDEFGRLCDYHVREIVFFGDENYVEQCREAFVKEIEVFLSGLSINAYIAVAADAFIMPKMLRYKTIQLKEKSKYELQVFYSNDKSLAAASFNLHGTAFTEPFSIKIKNVAQAVTGCIGFGIERWVLAFLAQYGNNEDSWPKEIQDYIKVRRSAK